MTTVFNLNNLKQDWLKNARFVPQSQSRSLADRLGLLPEDQ